MKLNHFFLVLFCLAISTTVFSQDIFTSTNWSGIVTSTGDVTIHPGATLTLDANTNLRMLAGSRITIRDGGRLFVNRGSTIEGINSSTWDGLRIDPSPIGAPDSGPAVIMIGGPTWITSNIINFRDASVAFRSTADDTERLRGFQLYGVDFTDCISFFLYSSSANTPNSISSTISTCKFIGNANTSPLPSFFVGLSDLRIAASEFVETNTIIFGNLLMFSDTENIIVERNQFDAGGISFTSSFENIRVSSNRIDNPQQNGIRVGDTFPGGSDVTISNNLIFGNSSFSAAAIRVTRAENLRIEFNTVFDRQIGITCSFISGAGLISANNIGLCTNIGIGVQGVIPDALGDGLIIRCNDLVGNGTAIQLGSFAQLPIHLMEWNGFIIETDPGNQFESNMLDIENLNTNATWTYHVIDAANPFLNPPTTTSGLVNLIDLENEGRYACDGEELVDAPGEETRSRNAEASSFDNTPSSIAPNPAREAFQLTLAKQWQEQQVTIDLIDISGKVLQQLPARQYEGNNIRISTQNLQAGYYFCRVSGSGQQPEVLKVVIVD